MYGSNLETNREEERTPEKESFLNKAFSVLTSKEMLRETVKSVASVAGVRSFYDVPEYLRERLSVRGNKLLENISGGRFGGGLEANISKIIDNLDKEEGEEDRPETSEEIRDLEKRLLMTKDAKRKGSEARKIIAEVIRRERGKESIRGKGVESTELLDKALGEYQADLEWSRGQKDVLMKSLLDDYTEQKVNGIQASKEALNTALVGFDLLGLRGAMYGSFSIMERYRKEKLEAKMKGEEVDVCKDVIVKGLSEFYQGISLQKEGGAKEKSFAFAKSFGNVLRFTGIGGTALSGFENEKEAIDQIINKMEEKDWSSVGWQFAENLKERVAGGLSFLSPQEVSAGEIPDVVHPPQETPAGEMSEGVHQEDVVVREEIKDQQNEEPVRVVKVEKGDTPWKIIKKDLEERLGRTPTDAEIIEITKMTAQASDIGISEWGIEGSVDHTRIPVGYEINFDEATEERIAQMAKVEIETSLETDDLKEADVLETEDHSGDSQPETDKETSDLEEKEFTKGQKESIEKLFLEDIKEIDDKEKERILTALFKEDSLVDVFDKIDIEKSADGEVFIEMTRSGVFFDDTFRVRITEDGTISMDAPRSSLFSITSSRYALEERDLSMHSLDNASAKIRDYIETNNLGVDYLSDEFESKIDIAAGNAIDVDEKVVSRVIEEIKEAEDGKKQFIKYTLEKLKLDKSDLDSLNLLVDRVLVEDPTEEDKEAFRQLLEEINKRLQRA